jgi:hypothetical protein
LYKPCKNRRPSKSPYQFIKTLAFLVSRIRPPEILTNLQAAVGTEIPACQKCIYGKREWGRTYPSCSHPYSVSTEILNVSGRRNCKAYIFTPGNDISLRKKS